MGDELRDRVESWLSAMGNSPEEVSDPDVNWHLEVEYPVDSGLSVHVIQPSDKPRAVVIVSATDMSAKHIKAFDALSDGEKRDFQIGFRREINVTDADFRIQGSNSFDECLERFQISATRYEDGLTLDSFARSVGAVHKVKLRAILYIQEHLDNRGPGSGGRFDFERLGL